MKSNSILSARALSVFTVGALGASMAPLGMGLAGVMTRVARRGGERR